MSVLQAVVVLSAAEGVDDDNVARLVTLAGVLEKCLATYHSAALASCFFVPLKPLTLVLVRTTRSAD